MQLHEKYRPKCWEDVVGQPKAISAVRGVIDRQGAGGQAFWISGASGTGKTTIARIIAGTVADPWATVELVGRELTAERLREIFEGCSYYGMGKGGRAVIVNEAHGLRTDIIERLHNYLDEIPRHVCWVFTTTREGHDKLFEDSIEGGPLLSRCKVVALTTQGLARAFAERIQRIAVGEGLDGRPLEAYVKLMQRPDVRNNFRAALQIVEQGGMTA